MTAYIQRFQVTGRMAFPIDMLRYDACYPDSERDAAIIAAISNYNPKVTEGQLTVSLRRITFSRNEPISSSCSSASLSSGSAGESG